MSVNMVARRQLIWLFFDLLAVFAFAFFGFYSYNAACYFRTHRGMVGLLIDFGILSFMSAGIMVFTEEIYSKIEKMLQLHPQVIRASKVFIETATVLYVFMVIAANIAKSVLRLTTRSMCLPCTIVLFLFSILLTYAAIRVLSTVHTPASIPPNKLLYSREFLPIILVLSGVYFSDIIFITWWQSLIWFFAYLVVTSLILELDGWRVETEGMERVDEK